MCLERKKQISQNRARLQYNLRRIMSKKNINANVGPLPALAKSSKKGKTKSKLNGIDDFIVDDQSIQPEKSSQEQLGRLKKLRKVGDKNKEKERIIQESEHSNPSSQIQSEYDDQKESSEIAYERFKKVDDDDIKRIEAEGKDKKSKNKGKKQMKKGQQKLETFIYKHPHQDEQKIKKSPFKSNKPQNQLSLAAMFASCAQPKKQEPITSSKMIDESHSKSDSDQDSLQLARKRRAMMNDQKNTGLTDEEAIKIALMESMKDIQPRKPTHTPIDSYSYQAHKTKSTDFTKQQIIKKEQKKQPIKQEKPVPQKNQNRKRQKSVGKKKQDKVQKSGILSGLGIVLTGEFEPYSKNKILQLLEQLGADLPKSITKKTTHLLQGSFVVNSYGRKTDQDVRTTTKSQQAAQKNVKIIPFSELDDFFVQKTGKTLEQHMEKDRPPKQIDSLLDRFLEKNQNGSACKTLAHEQIAADKQNHGEQQSDPKNKISGISVSWTEKYKPRSSEQIIGQPSQIKMLKQWLQIWEDIHIRGNKRDVKPSFNSFMPSGTINSNAALLSGDAGLGKTTTARLVASEFGYSVIQYNASDARNKKSVELLTLGRDNLSFMNNKSKDVAKTLIIMDEVDGMSSGDRGGIAAIINMIKSTKVPIICICNDRQSTKIRSLAGHCYDIKFHKPDKRQIAKRLEKIIQAEHGTSTNVALQSIVELLQNDIRQILTYLQVMFKSGVRNINSDVINRKCNTKDTSLTLNHFEATKNLLTRTVFKEMTILQKTDLAYVDSDMVPLMVQQNYLASCPKKKLGLRQFKRLTKATEAFTKADMLDRTIMRSQNYCLMPNKMFLSCIYPCEMVSQNMGFPKFTQWLGKFSSQRKNKRLIKQLKYSIACATPATFYSTKFNYAPMILERIYQQLRQADPDIDSIIQFMWHYSITPAILNEHICLLQYGQRQNLIKGIETSKKTKLTKTYNKKCETTKFKKEKMKVTTEHVKYDPVLDQMEEEGDEEEEDEGVKDQDSEVIVEKKGAKSKPKPKKK